MTTPMMKAGREPLCWLLFRALMVRCRFVAVAKEVVSVSAPQLGFVLCSCSAAPVLETDHEEPAGEAGERWPMALKLRKCGRLGNLGRLLGGLRQCSSIPQWSHRSQELLLPYLTVVPRAGNFKDRPRGFNRVRRGTKCSACHYKVRRTYFMGWLVVGAVTVAFFRVFSDSVEVRVASVHGEQKPREESLRFFEGFWLTIV